MEWVWYNNEGDVRYAPTGFVRMDFGDAIDADDPFVKERPDLFSQTPLIVRSTTGRPERREATPLPTKRPKAAKARG